MAKSYGCASASGLPRSSSRPWYLQPSNPRTPYLVSNASQRVTENSKPSPCRARHPPTAASSVPGWARLAFRSSPVRDGPHCCEYDDFLVGRSIEPASPPRGPTSSPLSSSNTCNAHRRRVWYSTHTEHKERTCLVIHNKSFLSPSPTSLDCGLRRHSNMNRGLKERQSLSESCREPEGSRSSTQSRMTGRLRLSKDSHLQNLDFLRGASWASLVHRETTPGGGT